jgi:hypothetical protein
MKDEQLAEQMRIVAATALPCAFGLAAIRAYYCRPYTLLAHESGLTNRRGALIAVDMTEAPDEVVEAVGALEAAIDAWSQSCEKQI